MVTQNLLYHLKSRFQKLYAYTFINESMSYLLLMSYNPTSTSKYPHALLD